MNHVRHAKDREELVKTLCDSRTFHIRTGEGEGKTRVLVYYSQQILITLARGREGTFEVYT